MKVRIIRTILFAVTSVFLFGCEDVIDVDLDQGKNQLVVDAFLTSDTSQQIIRLTESADFFLNAPTPPIKDAEVKVIGPGLIEYEFLSDDHGNFVYDPLTNGSLDSTGFTYQLELIYQGLTYSAVSVLNPVPVIDSMTVAFEEEGLDSEEGYYAQFFARDFPGRKDYYWIIAYKNGEPIFPEDPSFLILSEDASFGGDGADGFPFILPIRAAITNEEFPMELGDTSSVELWSMNGDAYNFIEQVTIQASNDGLFSTPPANVRSNIFDETGNVQEEVLGIFSISGISKSSIIAK